MRFRKHRRFYLAHWKFLRVFLAFWIASNTLFIVSTIWEAISSETALGWELVGAAFAMILAGMAMTWFARHWFNFLAGEEICHWRKQSPTPDQVRGDDLGGSS